MTFRFSCFLLCFLLSLTNTTYGQLTLAPGYLINATGDSLPGQLEYVNSNFPGKRAFIPSETGRLTFLEPSEIKEFYLEPQIHFKTVALKGKKVLMQVITEGQLNLYAYKRDLFLRSPADSLILLTGGRKTVEQNGQKTAIVDYTYKSQLRKALPDNTNNAQLDKLPFERKKIKQFARQVNGSPEKFSARLPLKKRHQFEIRAGFTFTKAVLTYIPYQQDSLRKRESFMQQADLEYLADEKQQLGYLTAGFLYKWKIGRKYSYLKTGLLLNQALKTEKAHKPVMHTRYKSLGNGYAVLDTVGYSFDYYTYNLSNTEIPVSYYAELTDGRLRPFLELGLTTKIYHQASVSLKREIHDETRLLRTETGKMKLPGFSVNPLLGFGCRYLINQQSALILGTHLDYYRTGQPAQNNNFRKAANLNVYMGYGF